MSSSNVTLPRLLVAKLTRMIDSASLALPDAPDYLLRPVIPGELVEDSIHGTLYGRPAWLLVRRTQRGPGEEDRWPLLFAEHPAPQEIWGGTQAWLPNSYGGALCVTLDGLAREGRVTASERGAAEAILAKNLKAALDWMNTDTKN